MKETKERLLQAQNQINKALKCLEENTLESMLNYFAIGADNGERKHLSAITTFLNEVPTKTAELLSEHIKDTGFKITTQNGVSNSGTFVLRNGEEMIAYLELYPVRTINSIKNINRTLFDITKNLASDNAIKAKLEEKLNKLENEFEESKNKLTYKVWSSSKKEQKTAEHEKAVKKKQKQIEDIEVSITHQTSNLTKYKDIQKRLKDAFVKLEELGFNHNYNKKEKEFIIYRIKRKNIHWSFAEYQNEHIVIFDKTKLAEEDLKEMEMNKEVCPVFFTNEVMEEIKQIVEETEMFKHVTMVMTEKEDNIRVEIVSPDSLIYHITGTGEVLIKGERASLFDFINDKLMEIFADSGLETV